MQKPPAPTPFCYNPIQVRTIVLGADPSNFSDKGERKILTKVFGIGDGDSRYFQSILKNLNEVGFGLENIFVDNLIQDYLDFESSDYKLWEPVARKNMSDCLARLDSIDRKRKLPVFLTTEVLYKVLINFQPISAAQLYSRPELIPIPAESNALKRPLIPFYRHQKYLLSKHKEYKAKLLNILGVNNEHKYS